MTEDFASTWTVTDYRVRLSRGGYAIIRVGQPLPTHLHALTGAQPWGFLTAWNPRGVPRDLHDNRIAQRQLVNALRALPATVQILPAIGVGVDWSEPSLFVIGPDLPTLDELAARFQQLAWVHADAVGIAQLRWTLLA